MGHMTENEHASPVAVHAPRLDHVPFRQAVSVRVDGVRLTYGSKQAQITGAYPDGRTPDAPPKAPDGGSDSSPRCDTVGEDGDARCRVLYEGEIPFAVFGAQDGVAKRAVLRVLSIFDEPLRREIERAVRALGRECYQLQEIRLSLFGRSSFVLFGEEHALSLRLKKESFAQMVRAICHGTPFSFRPEMAQGYLPFADGVRVGVIGEGHYDTAATLVGISDIHTLIFRIPHLPSLARSSITELADALLEKSERGCLILSPPRMGKTTLLRAVSHTLADGERAMRVAVVDTRREFLPEDQEGVMMDVLIGYRREEGAGIALRTLSPSFIVMDEIGTEEDARAIRCVMSSGVRILASAHASCLAEAQRRPHLFELLREGAFDCVLTLGGKACGGVSVRLEAL